MMQLTLFEDTSTSSNIFHNIDQIGAWQEIFGQRLKDFATQRIPPKSVQLRKNL